MLDAFLQLAEKLNKKFNVTPLLFGSLGLETLVQENLQPDDIDVLIPEKLLSQDWNELIDFMDNEGYVLIDLHEHTFIKDDIKISFAQIDNLPAYAQIELSDIEMVSTNSTRYLLLNLHQYLKVYQQSSKDSYRRNKNNDKDLDKIELIQRKISGL